ncbi:hypothetical protein BUALT_Bualt07G0020300 [Buddleja alternifolia]|uniref:Uncharacterized protein n=1 Tax=Buddleja alternifolia TaxID=168488 RepID=A0AAV6XDW7_9LAMI|nr:hypothetical protein BUALT_Bualt07G0020300 [Buddleja alternifolia]
MVLCSTLVWALKRRWREVVATRQTLATVVISARFNISPLLVAEGGTDYIDDIQEKLDAPMQWIGMYIAAASAICTLAMVADLINGIRSKRLWFPCKYFTLNATYLTLLAVSMKFIADLTGIMRGREDNVAKVSSLVLMSSAMCNSMTSLASMDSNQIVSNLTALSILVITIVVNVCIHNFETSDGFYGRAVLAEEIVAIVFMLLLLVILCCSSLAIPTTKRYIDSKYHELHKITRVEGNECRLTIDEMRLMIQRYWVMAETGSPQFVMARSVLSGISGLMGLLMVLTMFEAQIRLHSLYDHGYEVLGSDYKWSITWILYIQFYGATFGALTPISRWMLAGRLKISETGHRSLRDQLKIERYWTLRLVEWRESSLSLNIQHHQCRKLLNDAKRLLLNICIIVHILVVLTSKLMVLISSICGSAILLCLNRIGLRPSNNTIGSDLSRYVLLLEGEAELPNYIIEFIRNQFDKLIQTGRRKQPKNLVKLLHMSRNFDGVIKFDDNVEVASLHSQEPPNCWSLPVVTLTSIAVALPNIAKHKFNELLSGVREGLYFVNLIEKSVDGDGELTSVRNAADAVWVRLELYHKWQDKDIQETSQDCRNYMDVLQDLSGIAKKTVEDFKTEMDDFLMQNPLNWPIDVIAANSMYRITQTVLLAHKDDDQETDDEEVFERLYVMISDIFAACLTNLVPFLCFECHSNVISERVKRVGQAAGVLGESEEIIKILQQRALPDFCVDPAKASNIEEWRRAFIPAVSSNETSVPQSNGKHVTIELGG